MASESGTQVEAQSRRGKEAVALATLFLALVPACAATPVQKAQADFASAREEHTRDKLVERGKGFAAFGDLTRAEEYLVAALDQGASPKDVLPTLVDVCVRGGRYRSAIVHAENHLRKFPHDHQTRVMVGTLYVALGETKDARANLEKVIEEKPDNARAHYLLGVLARDSENDVVGADRHFREYIRIEPNGAHAEEARESMLKKVPQ